MQFLRKILGGKIMSLLTTTPTFLYPHSRQFPFDEVAEKIVKAIEKRNWKVPGITIEFDTYGSGEAKYQMVRSITGDNFKLYFCRIQGRLKGNWNDPAELFFGEYKSKYNDTAALSSVCIPKQILEVYNDESGPDYYLYVGKDWEADKEWFMNSIKVHSKLNKEHRRYLMYSGKSYCRRAKELIADNDFNREYSPEGNEPVSINLEQKFNEFTEYLEKFVLGYILSFEEAKIILPPIPMEEPIPYKGPWTTIYSICELRDAERIKIGKKDPNDLPPEERYAYFGSSHRLVPLDVSCNGRFPKIAYEGFIWCDVNKNQNVTKNSEFIYEVMSAMHFFGAIHYIVSIKLKYANQVYVVDNSKYEETRKQLFEAIAPRDRLTDEELGQALAARGATIVPITEYKGDFKEPILLINRELEFDEIDGLVKIEK